VFSKINVHSLTLWCNIDPCETGIFDVKRTFCSFFADAQFV